METVTIPKGEYERLKRLEEKFGRPDRRTREEIAASIDRSIADIKAGRVKRVA